MWSFCSFSPLKWTASNRERDNSVNAINTFLSSTSWSTIVVRTWKSVSTFVCRLKFFSSSLSTLVRLCVGIFCANTKLTESPAGKLSECCKFCDVFLITASIFLAAISMDVKRETKKITLKRTMMMMSIRRNSTESRVWQTKWMVMFKLLAVNVISFFAREKNGLLVIGSRTKVVMTVRAYIAWSLKLIVFEWEKKNKNHGNIEKKIGWLVNELSAEEVRLSMRSLDFYKPFAKSYSLFTGTCNSLPLPSTLYSFKRWLFHLLHLHFMMWN